MSIQSAPDRSETESGKKYTAFLCSHTHWDREWYGTFQQFRLRLVRLIDRLLVILDGNPGFRCFNLDGQTIVLEDYLEVKPEKRAQLEKYIQEGRIAIGPWYILPDEWLVSGEATIRNMLRGRAICRAFGVSGSNVGYLPDMFGHISQMPQILRGFGIDNTIFWRGISGEKWMSELWWEGPDGSRLYGFHLPEYCGYCNAAFFYHSLPLEARTLAPETPGGHMVNDDIEFATKALRHVADRAISKSRSGQLLFMNGVDHMEPQPQVPEIIGRANTELGDVEVRHATYQEFMDAVKASFPEDAQVVIGEQQSTGMAKESGALVLPNIMSSRIYLKLSNAKCQTLLERWAEPFCSAAAWLGNEYPKGLIHTGWKHLLRNHPHDSIGGCSIDEVHRQMEARFEETADIAEITTGGALYQISEAISTADLADNELAYYLFNPLNWPVTELVTVAVDVDEDWLKKQGVAIHSDNIYRSIRNLRISEWDGTPASYEILNVEFVTSHRPWVTSFAPLMQVVRFTVALEAKDLPAFGYKGYRLSLPKKAHRMDNRRSSTNPARMANEHLWVEVKANGTLTIGGKQLGSTVLENVHYFEDGGDNGDGYNYSPPRHDAVVTSLGNSAAIVRLTDSDAVQSVAVDYTLEVPTSVTADRQHRTAQTVPLKVRSVFRLGGNAKRIDVETTLTNVAKDHRLQICFDIPRAGETHFTGMQFDVVERANQVVQPDEEVWIEDMPLERPQQDFVSYGALAVASFGIPEYEMADGNPCALKLTLLRAANFLGAGGHANTIIGGAGPHIETPDQQQIGRTLTFRYSIIPHRADWLKAEVLKEAQQHNALWRGVTTGKHAGFLAPDQLSFLDVTGANIVLSAVKQVETDPGAYVVRFWNYGDKESKAVAKWHRKPLSVFLSNLAEEASLELPVGADGIVRVDVKPKQIVTLLFHTGR